MNCDGKIIVPAPWEIVPRAFRQRLRQGLQHPPFELRQLIEKQDAVMRQRDFAGRRVGVAAEQSGVAGGMVRRAERALRDETGQPTDSAR